MTSGPHPDYGLFAGKVFISVAIVAGTLLVTSIVLWFAPGLFFLTFGAVLLAILIHGMSTWVGKITKLPDFLSALVVILTILGILFFIIDLLAPRIAVQAGILKQQLPDAVAHLRDQLESSSLGKQLVGDIPNIQEYRRTARHCHSKGGIMRTGDNMFQILMFKKLRPALPSG